MSNTGIAPAVVALALLGQPPATASPTSDINIMGWAGLGQGAVGAATPQMVSMQARFKVTGTLGAAGVLVIQGSNDLQHWVTLGGVSDLVAPGFNSYGDGTEGGLKIIPLGNGVLLIAITEPSADSFRYFRPVVQGGDGTTSINVLGQISNEGAI